MNKEEKEYIKAILAQNEFYNTKIKNFNLKIIHQRYGPFKKTAVLRRLQKNSGIYEVAIALCPDRIAFHKKVGKCVAVSNFLEGNTVLLRAEEIAALFYE